MLKPWKDSRGDENLSLLDLGCGSGRHIALAHDLGFGSVTGSDIARNGLEIAKEFGAALVCADSRDLPFRDSSFDAVVSWGSLHYGPKADLPVMISEILRILNDRGALFGTLRSSRDTMMKKGTHLGNNEWRTSLDDIGGSIVSFYTEDELKSALSPFPHYSYGLIERTPLGNTGTVISHWYFRADR
jgi:ubiquinone/menaquinone biosynthesis C-methylase UbiE